MSSFVQQTKRTGFHEVAIMLGPLVAAAAVLLAVALLPATPAFVRAIWMFFAIIGIPLQVDLYRQRLRVGNLTTQTLTMGVLLFLIEGALMGAYLVLQYQAP